MPVNDLNPLAPTPQQPPIPWPGVQPIPNQPSSTPQEVPQQIPNYNQTQPAPWQFGPYMNASDSQLGSLAQDHLMAQQTPQMNQMQPDQLPAPMTPEQQGQMTHQAPSYNPVPDIVSRAGDYWNQGLSANPTVRDWINQLPGGSSLLGLIQSPSFNQAAGASNPVAGGMGTLFLRNPYKIGHTTAWDVHQGETSAANNLVGSMHVTHVPSSEELSVDWLGREGSSIMRRGDPNNPWYNTLGTSEIRTLMPELQRLYPQAKWAKFWRAGGARYGPAMARRGGAEVRVPLGSVAERTQARAQQAQERAQYPPPSGWTHVDPSLSGAPPRASDPAAPFRTSRNRDVGGFLLDFINANRAQRGMAPIDMEELARREQTRREFANRPRGAPPETDPVRARLREETRRRLRAINPGNRSLDPPEGSE